MTINVLFAAKSERWETYEQPLRRALADAGLDARLSMDFPPAEVDYIVYAPNSDLQDFTPYTRAKAVLNLWAGVENVVGNDTLKIPLARMVDPGLTKGMVEWVTGHVMRYHLGLDTDITRSDARWEPRTPPQGASPRWRPIPLPTGAGSRPSNASCARCSPRPRSTETIRHELP